MKNMLRMLVVLIAVMVCNVFAVRKNKKPIIIKRDDYAKKLAIANAHLVCRLIEIDAIAFNQIGLGTQCIAGLFMRQFDRDGYTKSRYMVAKTLENSLSNLARRSGNNKKLHNKPRVQRKLLI